MMAYREKHAWLTLGLMLLAYGVYFGLVGPAVGFGRQGLIDVIRGFGAVAAGHAVLMILGVVILALSSGREARAKPDERDRAIHRRGATAAYVVLLVGMIWVGVVLPFGEQRWVIVNVALGAIVLAEAVRYGVILLGYRRGWGG